MDLSLSKNDTFIIKGIAICLMLWHHLFCQHFEFGHFVYGIAGIGKVCVALFVIISGYGLAVGYSQRIETFDMKLNFKFLLHRFVKFYLNYWAVFIIVVPIGILLGRSLVIAYNTDAATNFTIYEKKIGNSIPVLLIADFLGVLRNRSYNITWWFNQLIIVLYLLFPLLFHVIKRNKILTMILSFLLMMIFTSSYFSYLFVFLMGITWGQNREILNKKTNYIGTILTKNHLLIVLLLTLPLLATLRTYNIIPRMQGLNMDPFIALNIIGITILTLRKSRRISTFISFLGKHSLNIYLIHTFVFYYFFKSFIYSFSYPFIIFLVLLTISLVVSVIIEFLKHKLCFYKLQDFIIKSINNI